jgi:hypothetical protein
MATGFDVNGAATVSPAHRGDFRSFLRAASLASRTVVVLAMAFAPAGCGSERTYTAEPIAARIVDAATGAPVEGVTVVAAWQAKGGLEGGTIMGYVTVMEDVTNANGEFSFPGWGPKKWKNGAIRDGAPLLILLKPTYEVRFLWETKYGVEFAPSHLSSSWNGKAIALRRFQRSEDEYAQRLTGIRTVLDTLIPQDDCAWRSVPRFLATVDRQDRAFIGGGSVFGLESIELMEGRADKACGSVKAYVSERGQ